MNSRDNNKKLEIIPKLEKYVQYMLEVILKLPRTEKFSIGTGYKTSMYKTLNYVMCLNKIEENKCLYYAIRDAFQLHKKYQKTDKNC